MSSIELATLPLISWIDVARRLADVPMRDSVGNDSMRPPKGLVSSEVFWTGLMLTIESTSDIAEVEAWLKRVFRNWFTSRDGVSVIRLAGPSARGHLPVSYEVTNAAGRRAAFRPHASLDGTRAYAVDFPERKPSAPSVVAFHSVKGGVGRTTAAMAFAQHMASTTEAGPILFIDADFEAPGVSYLYRTRKPEVSISLEDLLALAHADTSPDLRATIEYVGKEMLDQKIGDVFVLPVKRLLDDLSGFTIRPEHLVRARRNQPYLMVDIVRALAAELGCSLAVVDLRAGLVDIAVQFLTDPSVERVFVTTASGQATNALQGMLRSLGLVERHTGCAGRQPFVLVNQVPREMFDDAGFRGTLQAKLEEHAEREFLPSNPGASVDVAPAVESALAFGFSLHVPALVASADDWEAYVLDLQRTGFTAALASEMSAWLDSQGIAPDKVERKAGFNSSQREHDAACNKLVSFAEKMEFAETAENIERPMLTPPLQRLLSDFVRNPPIAVIEGTKGTGKTLTFRYLLEHTMWARAAEAMGFGNSSTFNGIFLPVLGSVNSSDTMLDLVNSRRASVAQSLEGTQSVRVSETIALIRNGLEQSLNINDWTDLWLSLIAKSAGFSAWDDMVVAVQVIDQARPIALFEGLEEVFPNPYTDATQADALRALLREVPVRLREEAGRPVGVLIFARSDMVEAVIEQNVQQFRASYRSYALTWLDVDIQELVVWLVANSGAAPNLWSTTWRSRSDSEREADLRQIWGLKLGADTSKEARSTEWVIAVLTDLTGRLTARDLVRFIKQAAAGSVGTGLDDRLLTPNAMRKAVEYTSGLKVDEYPKEVRELTPIFSKLRAISDLTTPFDRAEAAAQGIEPNELDILEKYGVAYADEGSFEVPELFRIGLGMKRKGARPNIISLTRKARERAKA
ncbi:KGGVGR-motif variant AAA ATPase [Paraburkholderia atlantica]|uniref:KGGVGR-motif variant AAA ATPase n=1 Tax=Paraburkholderia atlantica TaxID=2654982 RepID=UPI00160AEF85|nr:hypothetical protein [Paraburkholderia atlantica]MBB5421740.1 MinD-like ATPase involved in chromosome partitioning or flagellar assembly [Paraburkholderia atlantica]